MKATISTAQPYLLFSTSNEKSDAHMGIRNFFALEVLNDSRSVLLFLKANFQEVSSMTDEQKQKIIALRRDGAGYRQVAAAVGISINTVKSFCRRHSLVAKRRYQSVNSAAGRSNRILDGSGNGSVRIPAGINGGTPIWSW